MAEERQKLIIGLVGPVLPFRGGIAHYTTELHEALRRKYDGPTVSFKRLYPKFLYPGKTDKVDDASNEAGVKYVLDIYNPLSWRKTADSLADSGCDMVVLTWWTLIWQPATAYMARRLRKRGVKVTFLCHNLFDHEGKGVMGLATRLLGGASRYWLKQADAYLVQSTDKQEALQAIAPSSEVLFRLHPIYGRFPEPTETWSARGKLDLLFFGFIRPYKGLDTLIAALKSLNDTEVFLTIAGEAWGNVDELKTQLSKADVPNLELQLRYVSDAEAANYIARADAVVLPYRSATGSGVAALAYHYGKPVIATSVGGLKDAVLPGRTGLLTEPNNPEALAAVIAGTSRAELAAMRPTIEQFCADNTWDKFVDALADLA